jgi:hypothetical protein
MRVLSWFLAAVLWLAATFSSASPLTYTASDLWWNPSESGWGLNVIHQGNTIFATMYVYGLDGQPRWYAATNLVTEGDGANHDRPLTFTGALHEATGPALGTPFDPSRVVARQVGTMTFELSGPNAASVRYTVDGVSVFKLLQRSTFRVMNLAGTYVGYHVHPSGTNEEVSISIQQFGTSITMTTQGSVTGFCNYSGTLTPMGQLSSVTGTFQCTGGRSGSFAMIDIDMTQPGFTSRFTENPAGTTAYGRLGAARTSALSVFRGDGWRTDLWWDPNESGWGLNVIEQGDTLFATLYVYDAMGRPKWYSASNLAFVGRNDGNVDSSGRFTGPLYESTGPWFGAGTFNSATVTARQVGTMTFEVYGDRTGFLDFTADGVTVTRKALDRFAFRRNDPSGSYVGHIFSTVNDRGIPTGPMTMAIADSAGGTTVNMQSAAGPSCTFSVPFNAKAQYGHLLLLAGTVTCSNGTNASFWFADFNVTFSGFTATLTVSGYPVGTVAGVRTGVF